MAIKKNELYSSLWASCDKLRGGMDASQYKDYILTLLFVSRRFTLPRLTKSRDVLPSLPNATRILCRALKVMWIPTKPRLRHILRGWDLYGKARI